MKSPKKKIKSGRNKGKKYEKPLSLWPIKFEELVEKCLQTGFTEGKRKLSI